MNAVESNMSLLEHTGPSTFYTELAELPLPVSADFVSSDGASIKGHPSLRLKHIYCPPPQLSVSLM
jgi:hypothetical protein